MNKHYTIIIPIFNEKLKIENLLKALKKYSDLGHEVLIIDDGSTDGSKEILAKCDFIHFINQDTNKGKGIAIIEGLKKAQNNKIIIFDGDLELNPVEIKKFMILNKNKNINFVCGNRFNDYQLKSIWDIGNKLLTILFNFINDSNIRDSLCCAKSFFKSDININALSSKQFEIDVEITSKLVQTYSFVKNINLKYQRRTIQQGKKLRLNNSFSILLKILQNN